MPHRAKIPATDPAAFVDLDGDDLAIVDEQCLGAAVEVEIDQLSGAKSRRGAPVAAAAAAG
jgi:hypothetical protein